MHGWGQTASNSDTQFVSPSKAEFQGGIRGRAVPFVELRTLLKEAFQTLPMKTLIRKITLLEGHSTIGACAVVATVGNRDLPGGIVEASGSTRRPEKARCKGL